MKILFVHDSKIHVGGAETYMTTLRELLKRSGHETFLFSTGDDGELKTSDTFVFQDRQKGKITHHLEYYYHKPDLYKALTDYIHEVKPDTIHLQNIHKYTNTILRAVIKSRIPVVQTVHDIGIVCPTGLCYKPNHLLCEGGFGLKCLACKCLSRKTFLYEMLPQLMRKRLLGKIKAFIVMSHAFENKLKENGIKNVYYMRHFVDTEKFTPAGLPAWNRIVYSGMLTRIKGVDVLLRAMPHVLKKIPDATLVVVGEGPERKNLVELTEKLGIASSVSFRGKMPYEKMPLVYQEALVLAVPSTGFEQFSLSGLEAMACGIPAVGSNAGGIPEWIEDSKTGFLFKPFNPQDLAEKLVKVLSDKKLAKAMGEKVREKAVTEYSPKEHLSRMMAVYRSLL